jgi:hypothetical protein
MWGQGGIFWVSLSLVYDVLRSNRFGHEILKLIQKLDRG